MLCFRWKKTSRRFHRDTYGKNPFKWKIPARFRAACLGKPRPWQNMARTPTIVGKAQLKKHKKRFHKIGPEPSYQWSYIIGWVLRIIYNPYKWSYYGPLVIHSHNHGSLKTGCTGCISNRFAIFQLQPFSNGTMTTVWEKEFQLDFRFKLPLSRCNGWKALGKLSSWTLPSCLHRCTLRLVGKVPPALVVSLGKLNHLGKVPKRCKSWEKQSQSQLVLAGFLNHQQYHVQLAWHHGAFSTRHLLFFNHSFLI